MGVRARVDRVWEWGELGPLVLISKEVSMVQVKKGEMRILFAGESWTSMTIHVKGFDSFVTSEYCEGGEALISALRKSGISVDYIPNHLAPKTFPDTLDELRKYKAVVLSDIGSNTLLLHPDVFGRSLARPNRLEILAEYVRLGGGLCMIGGYMSFSGIDGKARYQHTALAEVLPVKMRDGDDRREIPQGIIPKILDTSHPVFSGIEGPWPPFLGYNVLYPRTHCDVLAETDGDVLLAIGNFGKGRSAAFASDCGPHWGAAFQQWRYYATFWTNLICFLGGVEI